MAALDTVANYVSSARILLQDTVVPYRYADSELVEYLNQAMQAGRRIRPDLFLTNTTNYTTSLPRFSGADSTAVNIEEMYRSPFLFYVVGMAQLRDTEDTQDQRAGAFLTQFNAMLLGVAA